MDRKINIMFNEILRRDRQKNRRTDRQIDSIDKQTDRQIDRSIGTEIEKFYLLLEAELLGAGSAKGPADAGVATVHMRVGLPILNTL